MSTLQTPVDVVGLLVAYLNDRAEVTDLVDDRIHGSVLLPKKPVFPLVSLHRFGGTLGPGLDARLDLPLVQVDVWGAFDEDGEPEEAGAWNVVAAVRAALAPTEISGTHAAGVVCTTQEVTGPQWLPDAAEGRPRHTWTVRVATHP